MSAYEFLALIFNTLAYLCCLTGSGRHKTPRRTDLEAQLPRERRHGSNATSGSSGGISHRPRRDTIRSEKKADHDDDVDGNATVAPAPPPPPPATKLKLATDSPEAIQHLDARLRELKVAQAAQHVEDVKVASTAGERSAFAGTGSG
jgi:hypothetical protein